VIGEMLMWSMLAVVAYTYCVYPMIMFVLGTRRRVGPVQDKEPLPAVSLVISLYNEERILGAKLANLKYIEYPPDKLEILIGSDGSDDASNEILRRSDVPNLAVHIFSARRGKAAVLNDLVKAARGNIVVFSDANTMYERETVRKLVRHFADPRVGAVCGELVLLAGNASRSGIWEKSYWAYETSLKKCESNFRTLIGATGAVYAIRSALYEPLPTTKAVTDDFLIPLRIVKKGYVVTYDPSALAHEEASHTVLQEFTRRVRIGASNFNTIPEITDLLNPRSGFVSFGLWSHKILRWCVPFFLLGIFAASTVLAGTSSFYFWFFLLQLGFLVVGFLGFLAERLNLKIRTLGYPYYFIVMNTALFVGFLKFLFRRPMPMWKVMR
jgi:biofilm PGA synthesis N-glycosyltransferase PgaC